MLYQAKESEQMYARNEFQQKIDDLEFSILSCILLKPELMEKVILEDKHFKRTQRMWQFMKSFYAKFHTFDINLAYSVCKSKYQIVEWMTLLLEIEPIPSMFEVYQKQLLELYNENEKDKYIIDKIFPLANDLLIRKISTNEFKEKVEEIYKNAERL